VGIINTIKSIARNTHRNLEIVIVDDGSTDDTGQLVKDFIAGYKHDWGEFDHPINIVYHYKENGGKGRALNRGIQISTGDIIMSIDADCVLDEVAVENFVKCFRDPTVMAAVGNVKIGSTKSLIATVQYLEFLFSFYFKKADSLVNTIYIIGGAAGAFRREVFARVGLYNPRNITEDIELSVRIQAAGMKIVYASDAIIYTEGASDLKGLIKQRQRWKRGRFQTFVDHRYLFFSPRRQHNKILTWLILPLAIFGEIQLFLEPLFLLFLYVYSWFVRDFSSFLSGVIVVSSMFFVQVWFDDRKQHNTLFYLMAPIGWMLFYQTTFVEFMALIKASYGFIRGKEMSWQRWQRQGLENV
jgi:cellulose synthase/poly-beta-1,6-N-acetylglucosamine synthase-like glycosyltransferase